MSGTLDSCPGGTGAARPVVFLLSGQGSHSYGMGRELLEREPAFARCMERLDAVVRRRLGTSVLDAIYMAGRSSGESFDRTLLTHPAIAMFELAVAEALRARGVRPQMVLGASLGELVAAALAGAMSEEEMLSLVIDHAEAIEADCPSGAMLAVLGPLSLYYEDAWLRAQCDLASVSFPGHFVLSGEPAVIAEARSRFSRAGVSSQELAVSHGFHSRLMDGARRRLERATAAVGVRRPQIPFVSCARARVIVRLDPEHFWDVTRRPILLSQTAEWLERRGGHVYVDIGPSGTLATMMKYNLGSESRSAVLPIVTPFGGAPDNLDRVERTICGPQRREAAACSGTTKSISG
jgi:acyl transferase domain-containing protein